MHRLVGFAFFAAGVALACAALVVSRAEARADYGPLADCISDARVRQPLDDRHQELVNALYACGVYKLEFG
jgi:hypothetical protein